MGGAGAAPVAEDSGPPPGAVGVVLEDWPGADEEPGDPVALEGSKVRPCKDSRRTERTGREEYTYFGVLTPQWALIRNGRLWAPSCSCCCCGAGEGTSCCCGGGGGTC